MAAGPSVLSLQRVVDGWELEFLDFDPVVLLVVCSMQKHL